MARRNRASAKGGVSIVPEAVTTASDSSSDCSTPPPSDNGSSDQGHDYFTQEEFHGFVPSPEDDLIAKLSKLSIHQGWSKNEEKRRRAEVVEFEVLRHYGPDKSSLAKWQELCRDVKIDPIPQSITQCKKALSRVYVNIFNILDHRNDPERYPVITFKNYKLFRAYTLKSRIFPLDQAKEEGFVKALLRPLFMNKNKVADLSKVGVMSLSMHVKSELVGEMSGGLARHSRSATWRGRNKAHPVVSSPSTPLCATQRIVDPLVYASKANNLHYALPVTLTAGGEEATMQQENERMKLKDGRTLSYAVYGSPVPQKTIVFMHGCQSSRYEGKLWHSACALHNVRIIAPDRPGSGLSTFQTNRRILDWPADVLALADHLKIHNFYVLGVSGGAPYVLACVKEISKDRLMSASIVSGLYPVKLGTAGMTFPSRIVLWAAPWMTGLVTTLFDSTMGKASRNDDPKVLEEMIAKEIQCRHPSDQEAIKDKTNWPIYVAMTRESFYRGSEGVSWEAKLNGSDWGFELGQLYVGDNGIPLTLWHGREDQNCPAAMAQKAKDLLPGTSLRLKDGEGPMSYIFQNADDILEALMGKTESEEYMVVGAA